MLIMEKSFLRCITRKEEYFSKIMSSYVLVMSAVRLYHPFGYRFLFSHHSLSTVRLLFMLVYALLCCPLIFAHSCSLLATVLLILSKLLNQIPQIWCELLLSNKNYESIKWSHFISLWMLSPFRLTFNEFVTLKANFS